MLTYSDCRLGRRNVFRSRNRKIVNLDGTATTI